MHPFDLLVQRDESQIRVAEAALLFAQDHGRRFEIHPWLDRLSDLAERVGSKALKPEDRLPALRTVLVEEEGLIGDTEDYYNPRNSFLQEVLARKRGIPISLSVIWLDVCRQLGWRAEGIGLPGHFITRCEGVLVDPFRRGRTLRHQDCERIASETTGQPVSLTNKQMRAMSGKAILTRMLQNLRGFYLPKQAWHQAACVLERLQALHPEDDALRREYSTIRAEIARLN